MSKKGSVVAEAADIRKQNFILLRGEAGTRMSLLIVFWECVTKVSWLTAKCSFVR